MTNAISVKDRLKKQAIEDGKTMQDKLVTYGLERTIYRLSVSNYVERFTLKGGIFLYALFDGEYARATMDIDLLAQRIPNDAEEMKKVFNDILGFRAFCDSYDQILEEKFSQFRIADITNGKAFDDGYRGVHVYYQKSGRHYPIEIQFNTLFDRQLNNWLHDYLYKKDYPIETGRILREKYESGLIRNEHEFKEVLNNVLSGSERS